MTYNIISTGSRGNAVIINDIILIDCGVSFKKIKPFIKNLQLVLLTHIHSDHFNKKTIKKLAEERPMLRFGCCEWLQDELENLVDKRNIDIYKEGDFYAYRCGFLNLKTFKICANYLFHNVKNCSYKIYIDDYKEKYQDVFKIFYATDTNSLKNIEAKNFNLYMVEANYKESEILERIKTKQLNGEFCYEYGVLKNHLSEEKALDWLYLQMGSNSEYIFLHKHEKKEE